MIEEFAVSRGLSSLMSSKNKGGGSSKKLAATLAAAGKPKPAHTETQGPLSWSSTDLRTKYRSETDRLAAYTAYETALKEADTLQVESGTVVAVPEVNQHPVYVLYNELVRLESTRASNRSRARNRMRRFVLDVHTVWVTNLGGLEEHGQLDTADSPKPPPKRRALPGGRDTEAITNVSSQIQSVANQRTFDDSQSYIETIEEDGTVRRTAFEEAEKKRAREPVGTCPMLTKAIEPGPEKWTLVNGEPAAIAVVEGAAKGVVEARVFVDRIRRGGEEPIWGVSVYSVATATTVTTVLSEEVVQQVARKIKSSERSATPIQPVIVHRQGVRVTCGDLAIPALCSVLVKTVEAHVRVVFQFRMTGKAPWKEGSTATYLPPREMTFETSTYEVVARLKKGGLVSATDGEFWRSAGNNEMWREVISMMGMEKWAPLEEEEDGGEEKKEEVTDGKKKKRKKKKKEEGSAAAAAATTTTTTRAAAAASNLTIPHHVVFLPTPQHDESDKTIRIGGLTDDQVFADSPLPPRLGVDDYFTCVSLGYELSSAITIKDGAILINNKAHPTAANVSQEELADPGGAWAKEMFKAMPPLSMRISGKIGFHQMCPGLVSVGKKGLWWPTNTREGHFVENQDDDVEPEVTRPTAIYLRDSTLSSSDGVLVNMALALESPLLSPLLMSWDPMNEAPPQTPHMECECKVPMFMNTPNTLLHHPLESELDARMPPTIMTLTKAELPPDFAIHAAHGTREKHRRRASMFIVNHGFRCKVLVDLLMPDEIIPPYVFGVTKKGAKQNRTGVNGRNMWHSEQRCVEQLCRIRGPIDYHPISRNEFTEKHGGLSNMPNVFIMKMFGYKLNELGRGGEAEFEKKYTQVLEDREAKTKQEALDAKIEKGQLMMEKNKAEQELMIRQEGLKQFEKLNKHGGKVGEGLSSRAWEKRVKRSVVIGFQSVGSQGWEQRLDPKYNQTFYHNTDPYCTPQLANQWDPPEDWDEEKDDMLSDNVADNSRGASRGQSRGGQSTFSEGGGYVRMGTRGNDSNNLASLLDDDVESTGSSVERMVDSLAQNDEFIKMMAYKLGVPESQIRGISRDPPLNPREDETSRSEGFRDSPDKEGMITYAGETELASDDDGWSDSDEEVGGDASVPEGLFPQDHVDVRKEFVLDRAEGEAIDKLYETKEQEWVSVEDGAKKKIQVPKLGIEGKINVAAPLDSLEAHVGVRGFGWRRLGKEKVHKNAFSSMKEHKVEKCRGDMFNQANKATMVGMVDPKQAVDHSVDEDQFAKCDYESMFIRNVLDDIDRCVKMTDVRVKRELMLMDDNVNTLAEIVAVQPSEFTTVDALLNKDNEDKDDGQLASENEHKAILAVKNANFDDLETVMDDGVQVDCRDEYGNTLLILSCQQGNKRMAKFLLRRGGNINQQNNLGCTVLHYCHEYKNESLFEYMKSKGADDSLVNADGCTCYEGLKKDAVDDI